MFYLLTKAFGSADISNGVVRDEDGSKMLFETYDDALAYVLECERKNKTESHVQVWSIHEA